MGRWEISEIFTLGLLTDINAEVETIFKYYSEYNLKIRSKKRKLP